MRIRAALLLATLATLAGCQTPPPSAYVRGSSGSTERPASQVQLGNNLSGEACTEEHNRAMARSGQLQFEFGLALVAAFVLSRFMGW